MWRIFDEFLANFCARVLVTLFPSAAAEKSAQHARGGFEPTFCGLEPRRAGKLRARVGSSLEVRARGEPKICGLRAQAKENL